MLTAVPLAGASAGTMEPAAIAAEQTSPPATQPGARASYLSERLRELQLDDAIEPALRFRPRA